MDKRKIVTSIVAVVLVLALIGGGAGYWFTRPIYKVNKAIERNDLETVSDLYFKLKEKDKAAVSDKMRLYCQTLSTSYLDGNADFETVIEQFDLLGAEVLYGDTDFNEMYDSINLQHDSKEAYKAATAAFEAKDYEKALEEYEKVLGSDENYKKVQENMEICKNELLPDFVGLWTNTIDIGPAFAYMFGMTNDSRFAFEMTSFYEFFDDGTGIRYTDADKIKDSFDGFIDLIIEITLEQYERQGISRAELNKQFKSMYGMSVEAYIKKNVDMDEAVAQLKVEREAFTYTLEDNTIYVTDANGNECFFTREGDELLLDIERETGTSLDIYTQLKIDLPIAFTKVE